jgi:hypothetical protein
VVSCRDRMKKLGLEGQYKIADPALIVSLKEAREKETNRESISALLKKGKKSYKLNRIQASNRDK